MAPLHIRNWYFFSELEVDMLMLFIWVTVAVAFVLIGKYRNDGIMMGFGVILMLLLAMVDDFPIS